MIVALISAGHYAHGENSSSHWILRVLWPLQVHLTYSNYLLMRAYESPVGNFLLFLAGAEMRYVAVSPSTCQALKYLQHQPLTGPGI